MLLWLERLRLRLGSIDALLLLSVMGLCSGILAGLVNIAFRYFTESGIVLWHPDTGAGDYEGLPTWVRFTMPVAGGVLVGFLLHRVGKTWGSVGVGHVLERMALHQGYLSWRNAVVQFVLGGMTLASGMSVGREGPGIHLGATAGSWLGQRMKLPNNSIRVLVSCGTAAAISASFNTPLAGVIFAMEVVMVEYTIASFVPVILASISGAVLSRAFFGHAVAFDVPPLTLTSLWEMPYFLLMGFAVGLVASVFIYCTTWVTKHTHEWSVWTRCAAGGLVVGVIAIWVPEIMGTGYDSVNATLHSQFGLWLLVIALGAKLVATIFCSGLGLPGGVIGPALFMGAMFGGVIGILGNMVFPQYASNYAFYAAIGMAAMMGAVLQAPLAALLALLELTNNPNIILPGMFVVVVANLVVSQIFGQQSLYLSKLTVKGKEIKVSPLSQFLRRVGVAGVMDRSLAVHDRLLQREEAEKLLESTPRWILIREDQVPVSLLTATDLARYLMADEEEDESDAEDGTKRKKKKAKAAEKEQVIDLLKIPGNRRDVAPVYLQATLEEALDTMNREQRDAVYIYRSIAPTSERIYGIVTRDAIESHYTVKK